MCNIICYFAREITGNHILTDVNYSICISYLIFFFTWPYLYKKTNLLVSVKLIIKSTHTSLMMKYCY